MTLDEWFTRHAKIPLAVLVGFVSLMYVCFVYYAIQTSEDNQTKNLKDLVVTSVIIGIQQNDRVLVESSLERAVEDLKTDEAFLCNGDKVIFNTAPHVNHCSQLPEPTFFQRKIYFSDMGFQGYSAYFLAPRFAIRSDHLWIFAITLFILILSVGIVFHIRRQFAKDILRPVSRDLISDNDDIVIEEFRIAKEKIKQNNKIKEQEAYSQAFKASKRKFSHNIQSPLRNINILKERIQDIIDPAELDLFNDVTEEVAGLAENLSIENPFIKDSKLNQTSEGLALLNIDTIASSFVRKKQMEWDTDPQDIEVSFSKKSKLPSIALVQSSDFKSIISNLLNNSKEAGATKITMTMKAKGKNAQLSIKDNGRGVSRSMRKKLFQENVTSKSDGSGYGLFHARKFISQWGGSIKLTPSVRGAHFRVTLPLWENKVVKIKARSKVVILEDNEQAKRTLKQKLVAAGVQQSNIFEFASSSTFLSWYGEQTEKSNIVLLADNDLGEAQKTGLEIITEQIDQGAAYLVTDGHEDSGLVGACLRSKISLIPKSYIEGLEVVFVS